jgi:methyl-accepting chemotaxis protein
MSGITTGLAMRNLLLSRLYIVKFLESNDVKAAERVRSEFEEMQKQTDVLDRKLENMNRRALLSELLAAKKEYLAASEALVTAVQNRNTVLKETLNRIGPEINSAAEDIKLSIMEKQEKLGSGLHSSNSRSVKIIIFVSLAAMLFGVFISWIITQGILKQLGKDPAVIGDIAKKIAAGDLAVDFGDGSRENRGVYAEMQKMKEIISDVMAETDGLIKNIQIGELGVRGSSERFSGAWRDMMDGVNRMTDSLVGHIDQIPAPFMIIDRDFTIHYLNRAGADVAGLPQDQTVGKKCFDLFRTSDCKTAQCACARAMTGGSMETGETDAHPVGKDLFITYDRRPPEG